MCRSKRCWQHCLICSHRGQKGSAGKLAQSVQRSAFPGRYDQQSAKADQILKGNADEGENAVPSRRIPGYDHQYKPGIDNSGARREMLRNYLSESYKPDALLSLATGLKSARDTAATVKRVRTGDAQTVGGGGSSGGGGDISAGGGWGGSRNIAKVAERTSGIKASSEKRGKRDTASGGVSDHWTGSKGSYAVDLPAVGRQGDIAAKKVSRRFGMPYTPGQWANKVIVSRGRKYRVQIGWKTAGHHDHVHVGVKRV